MRTFYKTIAVIALVLAPAAAAAQTVDTSALLLQIQQLQAQIAAQLANGTSGQNSGGSTPPQTGGHCVQLDTTLQKGDSGDDVSDLQNFLIEEGFLDSNATGFFGTLTETAVKEWQGAHGISPIGVVGPATRQAMADCGGGSSTNTGPAVVSNQCPVVNKPQNCANAVSVQLNGCTVGWQCTVAQLPAETFTATPVTGMVPLVVKFSGVVTSANAGFCKGNFCAATLVYGDGQTGAVPLPNTEGATVSYELRHTYQNGGDFIANLYQGAAGSGAPVVGNGIAIKAIAKPVIVPTGPAITVTPNFGTTPLAVTVNVTGVTSALNLSLEFGDGTFSSVQPMGTGFGATHTYTGAGSFTIKLRRTNGSGDTCVSASCPILSSAAVSVSGGQSASASLAANPSTGLAPLPITIFLNGASATYPGGVVLDFGDNTTEIVCNPNVLCAQKTTTHTYTAAGTYNVQLIAQSAGGTTILKQITVTAAAKTATTLKAEPASGPVPLEVKLTANGGNETYANGVILKYGDGATVTVCGATEICGQKSFVHTYVDGNTYSAQLIGLGVGSASSTIGTAAINATGGPTKIKVTGPNGTARKGESVSIAWSILGTKPTTGSVSFDLYTQAGTRIGTILTITNYTSGSATWKIPSSLDKNCSTTQPNGLCGVTLQPGKYRIIANTTNMSNNPEITTDANLEIKDELIAPGSFSISISPSAGEEGKPVSIKYRVANPPADSGVALWMVKPTGEAVGLIDGKLEADREQSTYSWTAGQTQPCVAAIFNPLIACMQSLSTTTPGQYHIVGKVYTPFNGNFTTDAVTVHAVATSTAFNLKAQGTGASCVVLTSNLAPGDTDAKTGGEVSVLQRFLAEDSDIYPEGTINGIYGNATRRAVERYQASKGIASSGSPETNGYGMVGPTTRASIAANCTANPTYLFTATPLTGRPPLAVTFTAKIPTTPDTYYTVDFGDGTSAPAEATIGSMKGVTHTYTTTGTYIARLSVQRTTCTNDTCVAGPIQNGGTATVKVTNVTTPPPQSCAEITHTLGLEDTDATTGGDVTRLQQFLAANPTFYPEGLVTGYYGAATSRAVGRYQAANSISQTGTVGPITLAAIRCKKTPTNDGPLVATPESGTAPLSVKFTTNLSVTTGSYRINFGDGQTQWLTASSATHSYPAAGVYTAELVQSIGNCFGLPQDALEICEIGYRTVVATKTINVAQQATLSVYAQPSSLKNGEDLTITWSTTNAPAGSKVRFEVYRDGATEATGNNDQGLNQHSSQLGASGTFTWTTPSATAPIMFDGGYGGYALSPGNYHITAKLYTGDTCWGYCASVPTRTINATAKSTSFTITQSSSVTTGGGGAFTGEISCNQSGAYTSTKFRLTFADGTTRDYDFPTPQNEAGTASSRQFADFPSRPVSGAGFWQGFGASWTALENRETSRTSGSFTVASRPPGSGGLLLQQDTITCAVSWH